MRKSKKNKTVGKSCSFRKLKIVTAIGLSQILFLNFVRRSSTVSSVLINMYSEIGFKPELNSSLI